MSIFLAHCLGGSLSNCRSSSSVPTSAIERVNGQKVGIGTLIGLVTFCKLTACLIVVVDFGLPFLVRRCKLSDNETNVLVSLFFLTVVTPNFILGGVIRILNHHVCVIYLLVVTYKVKVVLLDHSRVLVTLKYVLGKLSCNVVRPLVCSGASSITIPRGIALTLTFIVTVGCITVLLYPFVISTFRGLFRSRSRAFTF